MGRIEIGRFFVCVCVCVGFEIFSWQFFFRWLFIN